MGSFEKKMLLDDTIDWQVDEDGYYVGMWTFSLPVKGEERHFVGVVRFHEDMEEPSIQVKRVMDEKKPINIDSKRKESKKSSSFEYEDDDCFLYPPKITDASEEAYIDELYVSATYGDSHAQRRLGERLDLGLGVERDEKLAEVYLLAAAESKDAPAYLRLSQMYKRKNVGLSRYYFKRAVELGDAKAMHEYAWEHFHNPLDECSSDIALEYAKAAAELGLVRSSYLAGGILEQMGKLDEAILWYEKACKQGYMLAYLRLGFVYKDGGDGVPADPAKAKGYFQEFLKLEMVHGWHPLEAAHAKDALIELEKQVSR